MLHVPHWNALQGRISKHVLAIMLHVPHWNALQGRISKHVLAIMLHVPHWNALVRISKEAFSNNVTRAALECTGTYQ